MNRLMKDVAIDRERDPEFARRDQWQEEEEFDEDEDDDGGDVNIIDRCECTD